MIGRLFLSCMVSAVLSTAALAQPDFTTSRGVVEPAAPYAGDVVRHVFTVTNTGSAAGPVLVSTSLRRGFLIGTEGDCASARFEGGGDFTWHAGRFDAGATRRCTVTMLTRREAAGTFANVVTEIRTPPSGYRRVEAAAELGTRPDPNAVRVGPVMMTRAGMVVTALLGLFLLGIPIILLRARGPVEAPLASTTVAPPSARLLIGAWAAVVVAVGFLVYFGLLAREDWRAYSDYRETSCAVFGSEIDSFEHRSRDRERTDQSFKPVFALRYPIDGVETFSTGYTTTSALNFNTRVEAGSVFDRFKTGSTHPCWYDPRDPHTVVLARGPGGAYVFALLPIPVLLIGLSMLSGAGRRKAKTIPDARTSRA
jgi:hypothetical protein